MGKFKEGDILATTTAEGDMLVLVEKKDGNLYWRFSYRTKDCVFPLSEEDEREMSLYDRLPYKKIVGQSLYDVVGSYL